MSIANLQYWDNGDMKHASASQTSTMTYSMHYGFSVFEGVRCYKPHNSIESSANFFRLPCHIKRLENSAKLLNLELNFNAERLTEGHRQVVRDNNFTDAYLRPIVFLEAGGLGLDSSTQSSRTVISAWDWQPVATNSAAGIKVKISSYIRSSVGTTLFKAKASGNYLIPSMALAEAKSLGFDEAILLDERGFVTEGSAQNVFVVRNNRLYTPTLACALEGITRESIITLAQANGIETTEKNISREELLTADEVFFCSTACEVLPITNIDGRAVGNGQLGEMTTLLKNAFTAVVRGEDPAFAHWLTPLSV